MKKILEISNLSKKYQSGKVVAVENISLDLNKGEIATIVGSSGSGKTTLLRIISGLEIPENGTITLEKEILNNDKIFIVPEKRNCSLVFQSYALFPNLTVNENILFGKNSSQNKELIQSLFEITRIEKLKNRYPHEISGGQQQRVSLVRALATNPSLLLMDEPLSNLDQELRYRIRSEIMQLLRKLGTTTLIVSHDTEDALAISDKIIILKGGSVVQEGSPQEIYNKPSSKYAALLFGKSNFIPSKSSTVITKNIIRNENGEKFISIRPGQLRIFHKSEIMNKGFLATGYVIGECILGVFKQITIDCKVFVVDVNVINLENYKIGEKVNVGIDDAFLENF